MSRVQHSSGSRKGKAASSNSVDNGGEAILFDGSQRHNLRWRPSDDVADGLFASSVGACMVSATNETIVRDRASRENFREFRVSGEHEIESHGWIVVMLLIEVMSNVGSSGIGTVVPTARRRVRASSRRRTLLSLARRVSVFGTHNLLETE